LRKGVGNSLYVHSAPSIASLWLMPRLRGFAQAHPDIRAAREQPDPDLAAAHRFDDLPEAVGEHVQRRVPGRHRMREPQDQRPVAAAATRGSERRSASHGKEPTTCWLLEGRQDA
jgi:hypothetical protein